MKKLQFLLLVLMLSAGSFCQAQCQANKDFTKEVYGMLNDLPLELRKDVDVTLTVSLNKDHRLVVLDMVSSNQFVGNMVSQRLNGRRMISSLDPSFRNYRLPIHLGL